MEVEGALPWAQSTARTVRNRLVGCSVAGPVAPNPSALGSVPSHDGILIARRV